MKSTPCKREVIVTASLHQRLQEGLHPQLRLPHLSSKETQSKSLSLRLLTNITVLRKPPERAMPVPQR